MECDALAKMAGVLPNWPVKHPRTQVQYKPYGRDARTQVHKVCTINLDTGHAQDRSQSHLVVTVIRTINVF
jgi:hypothetical protein